MTKRMPLDQALKETLAPEPAPSDLREGLLSRARAQDAGKRRSPWMLRTAAAALLLALSGTGAYLLLPKGPKEPANIAEKALRNFMDVHGLDFQSPEACSEACGRWSKARLGFEAPLPALCAQARVVGGRACKVDGRPVAHFLLSDGRALYVFENPHPEGASGPGTPLAVAGGLQARAWNEQGRGYVMVEPPAGK